MLEGLFFLTFVNLTGLEKKFFIDPLSLETCDRKLVLLEKRAKRDDLKVRYYCRPADKWRGG